MVFHKSNKYHHGYFYTYYHIDNSPQYCIYIKRVLCSLHHDHLIGSEEREENSGCHFDSCGDYEIEKVMGEKWLGSQSSLGSKI